MKSYRDYFYSGAETFRNHLGIRDPIALTIAEAELTRHRMRSPIGDVDLTAEGLRKIHHHIFQDLYPWAGAFRTVDMVKVQERGRPPVRFAPGARIARVEIPRFFGELGFDIAIAPSEQFEREDSCSGTTRGSWAPRCGRRASHCRKRRWRRPTSSIAAAG